MAGSKLLTGQERCEMTAIPGQLLDCTQIQAIPSLRTNNGGASFQIPESPDFLSFPIHIDALNRAIVLTSKPLSRKYEKQMEIFQSTNAQLLQFLKSDAFTYEETGNTATTMFFDKQDNTLVAYCSTKCSALKIRGEKIFSLCPCVEIAVLCVDDRYRFKGIGQAIIKHILQDVIKIRKIAGVQLVTLFSLPDAVEFYEMLDFRKLEKDMKVLYAPVHKICVPMYFILPGSDLSLK